MSHRVNAPGKLNLVLYVGPTRPDGLHEIASLFESISLHDVLTLRGLGEDAPGDRVICPEVPDNNLVEKALRLCREQGLLDGPPVEVKIRKKIPIAAGLGGGSADAAAALRLIAELYDRDLSAFDEVAFALGADVPSQLRPGTSLVNGAGERVVAVDPRCMADAKRAYVIVAQAQGLSTADVFAQADRAGLPEPDLTDRESRLIETLAEGVDFSQLCRMLENAFEPAITALRPELAVVPQLLRDHGAAAASFTGSGPTCFGVFDSVEAAETAAAILSAQGHLAYAAEPVGPDFAVPRRTADG